jgi:tRNA(Ile)-lysidine synthase
MLAYRLRERGKDMDLAKATVEKVRKSILKYRLVEPRDRIVVAVSGGPDSVCLLDVLSCLRPDLQLGLVVAHFDHGLRPDEDRDETRFVASLAAVRNLPFETKSARLDPRGGSLEDRARTARYRFLEEVRRRFSAEKIALGHQRNDQAETVLMRLLRGSGTGGLSGIAPIRDERVIRPILELSRHEIETYLRNRRLSFKTDPTNREERFLRNRIRSRMIPSLEQYQPQVIDILAQTADILREDHAYLEKVAQEWLNQRMQAQPTGSVEIDVAQFLELPPAIGKRVIRHCVDHVRDGLSGVTWRHINAVCQLAGGRRSQGTIRLPKGLVVQRTYGRLSFGKGSPAISEDYLYILKGPGRYHIKDVSSSLFVEEMCGRLPSFSEGDPWTAYFDARKISYPLVLRNFKPGDKFVPLGMDGHKKVKDLFIDRKLPRPVRSRLPILLSGESILWVCGMMIDERVKVSGDTERVLKVSLHGVSDFAGMA